MKNFFLTIIFLMMLISAIVQNVSAIGICTGMISRYGRLDNVALSTHSLQTGKNFTISGKIVSSTANYKEGWFKLWSNSTDKNAFAVVLKEPPKYEIDLQPNSVIPFSITVKALQEGHYRISPQIYFGDKVQPISLSDGCHTEPVIAITGDTIQSPYLSPLKQFESGDNIENISCNSGLQLVIKAEDDSPACVKPNTVNILVQRGWGQLP